MKQVILLLIHRFDYSTQKKIDSLFQLIDENTDCFLLYHKTDSQLRIAPFYEKYIFYFSSNIIYEMGYRPFGDGIVVGNGHFPVLKFFLSHRQYDYFWVIEGDVVFNGSWKSFFKNFSFDTSDMLSTYVSFYEEFKDWPWWDSLKTADSIVDKKDYVKSFNPIYRLSNRALNVIHKYMLSGWEGHYEVLLASILHHHGLSVKDINAKGTYYSLHTFSHLPLAIQEAEANMLYHPIKEKEIYSTKRKNCVISVVGKNSLHNKWAIRNASCNYDVHLIVCDSCFNKYYEDADYLFYGKGDKMKLIFAYLKMNPHFFEQYDYFFLPDDDVLTNQEEIESLFNSMAKYNLRIAQPSLKGSYFTYPHTLQVHHCRLRYTNFIEMMIPCFSKDALKTVLETHNSEKEIECQIAEIIESNRQDMAIIDELAMVHVRPDSSRISMCNGIEQLSFCSSTPKIEEYGYIPCEDCNMTIENLTLLHKQRKKIVEALFAIADIIKDRCDAHIISREGLDGLLNAALFFKEVYFVSEAARYRDYANYYGKRVVPHLESPLQNPSFVFGELGKVWALWVLNKRTSDAKDLLSVINESQFNFDVSDTVDSLDISWEELLSTPTYLILNKISQKLSKCQSSTSHDILHYGWSLILMLKSLYEVK